MTNTLYNKLQLLLLIVFISGCSTVVPKHVYSDACKLFEHDDDWYDAAQKSQDKWKVPKHVLLAFVHQESRFQSDAQPPMQYSLGFIPVGYQSSAYGYSQALDGTWDKYMQSTGNSFASRSNIYDAMDFIGWYNAQTHKKLGIPLDDTYNLYLAYHEGAGGYLRKTYNKKPWLLKVSKKVTRQANLYKRQIKSCRKNNICTDPWPFCW